MRLILFFMVLNSTLNGSEMEKIAPYGAWESPITAQKIAEGSTSILNMLIEGSATYWNETRPLNKGRYTVVKKEAGKPTEDLTPPDFNARSFVHEYGGGAFTIHEGVLYASNGADNKVYTIKPDKAPIALTNGEVRFADMHMSSQGLIAVGEYHPNGHVENFLALISLENGSYKKIAQGYDFYAFPVISPSGKKLAWICWNHPNMPWNHTELWTAEILSDGSLSNHQKIAGKAESIFQPRWKDDEQLFFVSDRGSGWWNLHLFANGKVENIYPLEAEMGEPLWVFDRSTWTFFGDNILFTYNQNGYGQLAILDLKSRKIQPIKRSGIYFQQLRGNREFSRFIESYSDKSEAIVQLDANPELTETIIKPSEEAVESGYISIPEHISYPSNGRQAYGFYYPPHNKDYAAPAGEKPPLIIMIHGGPTAQSKGSLSLAKQFWTSRGFAVLDVNYGGSTGYGKNYRESLNKQWGIVDVEDCVNGALYLVEKGLVDPGKLVIRGGSAGGFTTLMALAFKDVFKAGANYFGVADLTSLAKETHKFESNYMEQLIGKYPEEKLIWEQRSPIHAVKQIKSPLIIFQGEDDPVVPKNQSEMIYEALKCQGVKTEMHIYPGEQHGFRQAQHIIHSLERELAFYREVFKLVPSL